MWVCTACKAHTWYSLPFPCLLKITTHLQLKAFIISCALNPAQWTCKAILRFPPVARSVCSQYPIFILIPSISNLFEMLAMNLHCIQWCGKQLSSKLLLMMMPHRSECEHYMEMLEQRGLEQGGGTDAISQDSPFFKGTFTAEDKWIHP